jgi:hypothetical protein
MGEGILSSLTQTFFPKERAFLLAVAGRFNPVRRFLSKIQAGLFKDLSRV